MHGEIHELRVSAAGAGASLGRLVAGSRAYPCALGRSGIRRLKREGDGATPAGAFYLRRLFFRADKSPVPECGLDMLPISPDMGWCDDPDHADYNTLVELPHPASHEKMWRDDRFYDFVIETSHNADPPLRGRGSAIFMHVARDGFAPTEGCIALQRDSLRRLLRLLGPETCLVIGGG